MMAIGIIYTISFSIILSTLIGTSNCSRPPKFISRPKTNCFKNVTNSYDQNQDINRNPKCIALNSPYYCLDIKLPYYSTTVPDYVPDLTLKSIDEVQSYLQRWQGARKLPKCWPILQVALCSMLMPQCEEDPLTGKALRTYGPNVDICNDLVARDECKFLERHLLDWPALFNCNDTSLYAKNCTNELRHLRFSSPQSTCQYPLVKSNDESTWFKDIGGCALHCKFPISDLDDQYYISSFIRVICTVGLISTLFAFIFFSANKASGRTSRMAKIIRICNICQIFVYLGWYLQFLTNSDIACDLHGSTLYGLPLVANACVLSFILTYIPGLTSLLWCAYLGKTCHEKLLGQAKRKKSPDDSNLNGTLAIFNYGIPLILFTSVAFLGHIDGNGLYGICTVGQRSIIIKSAFVFAPTIIGTLYGNYYFIPIVYKLAFINSKKPSLRRNLIRILLLVVTSTMQVVFNIGNYFYELANRDKWIESIDRFTACSLNLNNINLPENPMVECNIDTKPPVQLYHLEIISNLFMGIVISSWAFHQSNYRGLRLKVIDLLEDEKDKQRRQANNHLNALDSVAMEATIPNRLLESNHHDIIDMTSPTHEHSVELDGIKATDENKRFKIQPGTPSSLASMSIASVGTDTGSYIQLNYTHRNTFREKTSRDIVNDVRQSFQQHPAPAPPPPPGPPMLNNQQPSIDNQLLGYMMMMMASASYNPPDLGHPDNEPKFIHGFAVRGA